jgi:cyanophycinase
MAQMLYPVVKTETKMARKYNENNCPVPKGILLIIGGKEDKGKDDANNGDHDDFEPLKILECFKELINKKDPVIEVITTASGKGEESFADYKQAFHKLKLRHVNHIHHNSREQVLSDDFTERLKQADAFFLSGGDQLLLTSIYGGTTFVTQLKERYINEKVLIAGTSAGAMALSTPMIYAGNKDVQQVNGSIKVTTGLEFLKDVCIDTHFVDRSRFVRMAQVIATNPTCIGIGIEEDTAIVVRDGSKTEVIGNGIVTVIEGFHIRSTNVVDFSEGKMINILDLKVHLLASGYQYDIPLINPPHQ